MSRKFNDKRPFGRSFEPRLTFEKVDRALQSIALDPNYPCIAALQALKHRDYKLGLYAELGSGKSAHKIAADLIDYLAYQEKTHSLYSTFFAVFDSEWEASESEFESALWEELSSISRWDAKPWDPLFSSNPADKNFGFSFAGKGFFVVGMHPLASRPARLFPYQALVFNLSDQFEEFSRRGQYEALVKTIRGRDKIFSGSINPMVEKYGETWEAIQLSGKNNPATWKCPFRA